MAGETSIQRARRLAREKREREAVEKAIPKEAVPTPEKEKGFFDSFFDRDKTIDEAVEGRRKNQSTDSNN